MMKLFYRNVKDYKSYHVQWYSNKVDNLGKMGKSWGTHNELRMNKAKQSILKDL